MQLFTYSDVVCELNEHVCIVCAMKTVRMFCLIIGTCDMCHGMSCPKKHQHVVFPVVGDDHLTNSTYIYMACVDS